MRSRRIATGTLVLTVLLGASAVEAATLWLQPLSFLDIEIPGILREVRVVVGDTPPVDPLEISFAFTWMSGPGMGYPALGRGELLDFSVTSEAASVMTGSDCAAALGAFSGSCSITLGFDEPLTQDTQLAEFSILYQWIPPPGYEICYFASDPNCMGASKWVEALVYDTTASDEPEFPESAWSITSIADGGVRPIIPEPTTGALLSLGLCGLARRPRRVRRA